MPTLINKIKNDPRVSSVWDEGHDGWWLDLKTNWICDDTETGRLHEESLQDLWECLRYGAIRLRKPKEEGGESTDGGWFHPDCVPYVRAEERYIKLTPFQTWLLADRPEDCLVENLREQLPSLSEELAWDLVGSVTRLFRYKSGKGHQGYVASTIDTYMLTIHQRGILEDCFSGSTVCGQVAHLSDDPDPKERAIYWSAHRAVHIIAEKFRKVGLESRFIPDA